MDDTEYVKALSRLAEAYESGKISRQEFREQMASLRDRRQGREEASREEA